MCKRLRKIDALERPDHYYLTESDDCYYLMEYTSGRGYEYSKTNQLISNFKKTMDRKGRAEWKYKTRAIREASGYFQNVFDGDYLEEVTLVPIPPSKAKEDPMYDDRMLKMLELLCTDLDSDIREIITLSETIRASHETDDRPPPEELMEYFQIDQSLCNNVPNKILLFDDMVTTGSHFKACKQMLLEQFPDVEIIGIFIARRSIENDFL